MSAARAIDKLHRDCLWWRGELAAGRVTPADTALDWVLRDIEAAVALANQRENR